MIDLLENVTPGHPYIAQLLLVQAGIPPETGSGQDDQYVIEEFKIDKDRILIRDRQTIHILKVKHLNSIGFKNENLSD